MPQYFLESHHQRYEILIDQAQSIGITLDLAGQQPNHFGAPPATREPLTLGSFVGDTQAGGSCNVDVIHIVPHCNGTHTETVSHIVNDRVLIADVAPRHWLPARLISVTPVRAADCRDTYRPALDPTDQVISSAGVRAAVQRDGDRSPVPPAAIVIRTRPNTDRKRTAQYTSDNQPPFLTREAMQFLLEAGVEHLLVDVPSVDRMYDEGQLSNHHLFWNVEPGSRQLTPATHRTRTITEFVFVPDELEDGFYLLDIQVAPFGTDAAPSRPVLIPVRGEPTP